MDDLGGVRHQVIKVITAWIATVSVTMWDLVTTTAWENLAQFIVFVYTLILLIEWIVKFVQRRKVSKNGTD